MPNNVGTRNNGMTASAAALRYWERKQAVAANNLANTSTHGFKKELAFAVAAGEGLPAAQAATDRTVGTLTPTGAPLDVALAGDGFLVVDTAQGERHTRGGSFHLDETGHVVDAGGNRLLAEGGPLAVPRDATHVEIDAAGQVRADGRPLGRLRVEGVAPSARLQHVGGGLYLPDATRAPMDPKAGIVRQGQLEESNVGTVDSMVDMIEIQRAYAAVQKAMTTIDAARGMASTEIGKPI